MDVGHVRVPDAHIRPCPQEGVLHQETSRLAITAFVLFVPKLAHCVHGESPVDRIAGRADEGVSKGGAAAIVKHPSKLSGAARPCPDCNVYFLWNANAAFTALE